MTEVARSGNVRVMETTNGIGARVRRVRGRRTPQEVAGLAGIHWRTIYKIESGLCSPRLSTLLCIADALGVSVGTLIGKRGAA